MLDFPSKTPDHYATEISEVASCLPGITSYLTPMIEEIIEEKYVVTDSIAFDHAYLLSSKNDAYDNSLIVVLKTDAHADAGFAINSGSKIKEDVTFTFYSYITIPDVIVRQDGSFFVNYANNECCLNKLYVSFPCTDTTRKPYYFGYATLDEVYDKAVSPKLSQYNVSEYQ